MVSGWPDVRRLVVWSVGAGLAAVVAVLIASRWLMPAVLGGPVAEGGWTARSRAAFTIAGVQGVGTNPASGLPFSWIGPAARLRFPELPIDAAYTVTLAIRGGRTSDAAVPTFVVRLDGAEVAHVAVTEAPQQVSVTLPQGRSRSLLLLETTPPYRVAGAPDRGVMLDGISLAPAAGHFRPTRPVLLQIALAAASMMLGVLLAVSGAVLRPRWRRRCWWGRRGCSSPMVRFSAAMRASSPGSVAAPPQPAPSWLSLNGDGRSSDRRRSGQWPLASSSVCRP